MGENVCTFNKFDYCKFGNKCRKIHHLEICEVYYCENVKICQKRHPRKCYYYLAYGYCKFGEDCGFKHTSDSKGANPSNNDVEIVSENSELKKDLEVLREKHEKTQVYLDQLMEYQSKQDNLKKDNMEKEIEDVQNKFRQALESKSETINEQNKKINELVFNLEILNKENIELKQKRIYACDECDFESYNRDNVKKHKYQAHRDDESESESEEDESPTFQCDLCEYNSGWPDSVAFHYREDHKIQMNWEEAEQRLKQ